MIACSWSRGDSEPQNIWNIAWFILAQELLYGLTYGIVVVASTLFPSGLLSSTMKQYPNPNVVFNIAFNDIKVWHRFISHSNITWRPSISNSTRNSFQSTFIAHNICSHYIPNITSVLPKSSGRKSSYTWTVGSDRRTSRHTARPFLIHLVPIITP